MWNKWHSCHDDCRAGLARMWRRGKHAAAGSCLWMCDLNIFESKRWIIIWAWNHISDLWILKWFLLFYLLYRCVESNLCRIQIHSGTVCGIRFGWYFQHATSRLFCLFFLPENMNRWVFFFDEFHDGGFSVCFASHSHLGSMLFHVVRMFFVWLFDFECADPDDVFDCSLKYPTKSKESSRHLE